jgi:ferredoxin
VKAKIDGTLCSGHGRCFVLADEVYDLDDDGYNAQRGEIVDVAPGNEDAARLGAENCPEAAITIID